MNSKQSQKRLNVTPTVIYIIWSITALLTFAYGWSVFDNIFYASESTQISGTIHKKSSHRSRNANSNTYSTSYNIIYQFENPYVPGKIELEKELAPVMYAILNEGDRVDIYFNDKEKPKSRLSHPLHYWLMTIVWGAFLSFAFFVAKPLSKQHESCYKNYNRFKKWMLLLFFLPGLFGLIQAFNSGRMVEIEKVSEQNWPRWRALEKAVAKPEWWDSVPIKYFDPMNFTSEEYSEYVKKNIGNDKRHRQFKVAYVFLLLHQDDPLQMGWDLAKGTTREFMPLYEFFLKHHMYQKWQGVCGQPCSDGTQMVEMAGDLLSMKLDENQILSSKTLIQDIMKYKYERGNNRGKYYFLYSYRRFLEHTESVERAHEVLDALVEENLLEAQTLGLKSQIRKWTNFWKSGQRTVGMFSEK